jgi:hypothetical protein
MSTAFGHTDFLQVFLSAIQGQRDLPDLFDETRLNQAPARLRGLLVGLRQKKIEITHDFIKQRGALTHEYISKHLANCSALDSKLQELGRKEEVRHSQLMEEWHKGRYNQKLLMAK